MNKKTITTKYDVADHLRTPEEAAEYFKATLEEANSDERIIANARRNILRANLRMKAASSEQER